MVAWPVLMGLGAAGAVLFIKIARRRQATRRGQLGGAVPARPLSAGDARRMRRRYGVTAAMVIGVLLAVAAAERAAG